MKTKIIVALYFLFAINSIVGQENKKTSESLNIKLPSTVLIKGTSTLHDWESSVEKTEAKLVVNNLNDVDIETLNVNVEVLSIKSGKKLMDKLTYKALKAKEHPVITFIFKKGEIVNESTNFIDIKLMGDLTIAGVTKNVSVVTKINKLGNTIVLKGSHQLKMTDFGIKPPRALLGTIKTGDEITIEFNLKFN
ncbi:YceI family protein [Polaribacter septentrionalilitoris]|uniref:YceI family protein n=1 Tax=Polaribacter septentrionalilitoris TaxID=2494657 RepID=UPI00135BE5FB|nr:YceI family protein [Polaribacter septentrionalilitoris]